MPQRGFKFMEQVMIRQQALKDKLGIFFSGLCIAHCLVMPFLAIVLGGNVLVTALSEEWVHTMLLLPVFAMLIFSLPQVWLASRNYWLLALAIVGVVLLSSSRMVHGIGETLLTVVGSCLVIAAHLLSLKMRKSMKKQYDLAYQADTSNE